MAIKELFNDARPQVLFDPRASQRIDPRFKFTRSGPATYANQHGVVAIAQQNQPRIEYDSLTGESLGLLVEKSGTNQARYSSGRLLFTRGYATVTGSTGTLVPGETFTTSNGGQVRLIAYQDNVAYFSHVSGDANLSNVPLIAPSGSITSITGVNSFYNTAASNSWVISSTISSVLGGTLDLVASQIGFLVQGKPANADCIMSIYVKVNSPDVFKLKLSQANGGNGDSYRDYFVGTNTFSPVTGSGASTGVQGSQVFSNGWLRLFWGRPNILRTDPNFYIQAQDNAGNTVDASCYFDGLQIEYAAKPSSVIFTLGAAVTRQPDIISIESPLPETGSIYIDARSLSSDVDDTLLSAAPASPSTDKLALAIREPADLYNSKALVYEVDGAFKPTLPFPVPGVTRERNLITYGTNNYHYRSDSARYTPSSSSSVPANMTRLGIGHDVTDPTKAMTGYINAVYLWSGEITPTVAEALVRGDVDPKDADAGVFTPAPGSLAFVFNTQGTATDGNTVVQLPLRGSTNNVLVDWGDNTSSSLIGAAASVTVDHTYTAAGIYPVQITADDDGTNSGLENLQFYNNSPADLVRVLQWGGTTTFQPTTMYRIFRDCTQMDFENDARTNLPDTSAITDWREAFYNCSSLSGSFPSFDFSGATNFSNAWFGCSSMTAFPAVGNQTDGVTSFSSAWSGCSSLTSFPLIDTSAGTSFYQAWNGCSSLTSFPLIDTSSATNLQEAWRNCSSLTSFPLIDTSAVTTFQLAWDGCSSLENFELIDTSAGTNFYATWRGCSSLTSFPLIITSAGTNFQEAWRNCSSLASFESIDISSGTIFYYAWQNCSSLTDFPANFFDSWSPASVANKCFFQTWDGCTSLTPASVVNILNSIAASGQSAPTGTGTHDKKITIDWDGTGTPATDAAAAIITLKSSDWQIYLNGVLQ